MHEALHGAERNILEAWSKGLLLKQDQCQTPMLSAILSLFWGNPFPNCQKKGLAYQSNVDLTWFNQHRRHRDATPWTRCPAVQPLSAFPSSWNWCSCTGGAWTQASERSERPNVEDVKIGKVSGRAGEKTLKEWIHVPNIIRHFH